MRWLLVLYGLFSEEVSIALPFKVIHGYPSCPGLDWDPLNSEPRAMQQKQSHAAKPVSINQQQGNDRRATEDLLGARLGWVTRNKSGKA